VRICPNSSCRSREIARNIDSCVVINCRANSRLCSASAEMCSNNRRFAAINHTLINTTATPAAARNQ
jgi:hypothetical protein